MDQQFTEMQRKIDELSQANADLNDWKQKYSSHKQSVKRMSARLHKLCKKLTPSSETVLEMQQIAAEIKTLTRDISS